jgi:hypothetical protein
MLSQIDIFVNGWAVSFKRTKNVTKILNTKYVDELDNFTDIGGLPVSTEALEEFLFGNEVHVDMDDVGGDDKELGEGRR